jgi:hypothetical protein
LVRQSTRIIAFAPTAQPSSEFVQIPSHLPRDSDSLQLARTSQCAVVGGESTRLSPEGAIMSEFHAFAAMVAASFQERAKSANVFVVALEGDDIYARYLAAFPEGTNPIFKTRTEYDCSCCRQFIRRAGGVVTIDNGMVRTVWDKAVMNAPDPYREVAAAVRNMVLDADIRDLFRVGLNETSFGAAQTRSLDAATQRALTWNHFYTGEIPRNLRASSPGEACGDYRTTVQVFERGLTELTHDAVETVLSLVSANNLYRGEEHKSAIVQFQKMQRAYRALATDRERHLFAWGTLAVRRRGSETPSSARSFKTSRRGRTSIMRFAPSKRRSRRRTTSEPRPSSRRAW